MRQKTMFKLGAFAVILDKEGRVLLSYRSENDLWGLPGGGVDHGELPTEAVMRETREETGLEIEIMRLVGVYGNEKGKEMVFSFQGKVIGGNLQLTDEADLHTFFAPQKLPYNTIPKHVERIQDTLKALAQPIIRRQAVPSGKESLEILKMGGDVGSVFSLPSPLAWTETKKE